MDISPAAFLSSGEARKFFSWQGIANQGILKLDFGITTGAVAKIAVAEGRHVDNHGLIVP